LRGIVGAGECREGKALFARESEGCPLRKEFLRVGGRDTT